MNPIIYSLRSAMFLVGLSCFSHAAAVADTMTLPPSLSAPVNASSGGGSEIYVEFSLPEAALPGSVKLAFGGTVLTLSSENESAGAHWIIFDVVDPVASDGVVTGAPIADGVYAVTLSYQDALGNPAASTVLTGVSIDTTPPTLGGVFSPLVVVAGSVVPDFTTQAVTDAESVSQFPDAGTWNYIGTEVVVLVARDAAGNETYLDFTVQVVPAVDTLARKGAPVPGAGAVGSGIPAGALWDSFGVPSINDNTQTAMLGAYKVGAVKTTAVIGSFWNESTETEEMHAVAKKGDEVPGMPSVFYSTFKDPLLAPDSAIAFVAKLSGAVLAAENEAIILDADGTGPGEAVVVARKGQWKSFTSVTLGEHSVAFTANLNGATTATDSGLWVYNRDTQTTALALREGDALLGSAVKTISALVARPGSPGQGRGTVYDGGEDVTPVRVTLADGRQALGFIGQDGTGDFQYVSGGDAVGYGDGAKWQSFGVPTQNAVSSAQAFVGTVKAKTGSATSANNVAIFAEDDVDYAAARVVARGDAAAGVSGGFFSTLRDPVSAGSRAVAFSATMKTTAGITSANNDGIWCSDDVDGLRLVAREGGQPPDAPVGARWKTFASLAMWESRPNYYYPYPEAPEPLPPVLASPLFIGTMESKTAGVSPGPGGVTTANDTGLWATDSRGDLHLILREGDPIGASTVKTITVLSSVVGSPAQTRSFNNSGFVLARVIDATGAQHLLRVLVP